MTTTNLVTASGRSCASGTSTARPYWLAANAPASAASSSPSATWRAASAFDAAGRHAASGRWLASQCRHCAWACGWPPTVLISASSVPGRVSSANAIGSGCSAQMTRSGPVASSSRVAVTAPSTEFSMGTMPRSAAPLRTASRVAWMLTHGIACSAAAASKASSAASVKVPSGPRYAYRTGVTIPALLVAGLVRAAERMIS